MRIVLILCDRPSEPWKQHLLAVDAELQIDIWPDIIEAEAYTTAIVWKHPPGLLNHFPNLKLVCSLGAGVDHILSDPDLPDIPICRIVDAQLTVSMSNYIIMGVLNYQKRMHQIWKQQQNRIWEKVYPLNKQLKIGILGLGVLGSDAGRKLAKLGFEVHGYAQSAKTVEGVQPYTGDKGLKMMLSKVNVIVCLLPLTSKTQKFLNQSFFQMLTDHSYLIHVARGAQLVEKDLLDALDANQLSGAMLDVFEEEPLPQNHPFWKHPNICITPHIASITDPVSATMQMAENHFRALRGEQLLNKVDMHKEY